MTPEIAHLIEGAALMRRALLDAAATVDGVLVRIRLALDSTPDLLALFAEKYRQEREGE